MTYTETDARWNYPEHIASKSSYLAVKSRMVVPGVYEGLAAAYHDGERVSMATFTADTRARAVRGAKRAAREARP